MARLKQGSLALPCIHEGNLRNGVVCRMSAICRECHTRECADDKTFAADKRTCSFGVSYIPISEKVTLVGFFWDEWRPDYPASRDLQKAYVRNRKAEERSVVPREIEARVLSSTRNLIAEDPEESQGPMHAVDEFQTNFAIERWEKLARGMLTQTLREYSAVTTHDLLQIVSAIYQNAQYSLELRYGSAREAVGRTFPGERKLKATESSAVWEREKAVYYLCELAELRLSLSRDEALLEDDGVRTRVSVHGAFVKVIRPYRELARRRQIELNELGECYAEVLANYDSFHIGPLAVIDNAIKYAPPNSEVRIIFGDSGPNAEVAVESFGPRIDPGERERIFLGGVRGKHVRGVDGSGVGLWLAKMVVERAGGTITVHQSPDKSGTYRGYFRTTFSLRWPQAR